MKTKIILPLLAFVFAIAGAFASKDSQSAWFNDGAVGSGVIDNVNTDVHPCLVQTGTQCMIGTNKAYDSPETAANAPSLTGLLKYQ